MRQIIWGFWRRKLKDFWRKNKVFLEEKMADLSKYCSCRSSWMIFGKKAGEFLQEKVELTNRHFLECLGPVSLLFHLYLQLFYRLLVSYNINALGCLIKHTFYSDFFKNKNNKSHAYNYLQAVFAVCVCFHAWYLWHVCDGVVYLLIWLVTWYAKRSANTFIIKGL